MELVFREIEDPRVARTRAHLLIDILMIAILSGKRGRQGMGGQGKLWTRVNTIG